MPATDRAAERDAIAHALGEELPGDGGSQDAEQECVVPAGEGIWSAAASRFRENTRAVVSPMEGSLSADEPGHTLVLDRRAAIPAPVREAAV
ncbi:hypothetical protein A6A29_40345 [Streptomyces sp. TSRI0281]|nr:hypothetical protein A6A29_40345 [Streptomyces sp. TSRI0281]